MIEYLFFVLHSLQEGFSAAIAGTAAFFVGSVVAIIICLGQIYRLARGVAVLYLFLSAGLAGCVAVLYAMIRWPGLVLAACLCAGSLCAYNALDSTSARRKLVLVSSAIVFFTLAPLLTDLFVKM